MTYSGYCPFACPRVNPRARTTPLSATSLPFFTGHPLTRLATHLAFGLTAIASIVAYQSELSSRAGPQRRLYRVRKGVSWQQPRYVLLSPVMGGAQREPPQATA